MELSLITVFGAGVATLATPCILPMLPVYLSMLLGAGIDSARTTEGKRRLMVRATAFVAGFSVVFTLLGMAASALGGLLAGHRSTLLVVGGLLILLFGLKYLKVLRLPWLDGTWQIERRGTAAGMAGAFLFGVVFALGWTPCVGPILGTVLTYTAATTSSPAMGALYLFVYSLGVGLPLLGLSLAADRLVPQLRKLYRHLPKLEAATGVLLVVTGLGLVLPALVRPATAAGEDGGGPVAATGEVIAPELGRASERPRLVEFFGEDCPVCRRMKPRLAQLREDCVGHQVEILEVSVDEPRNQSLVRQHRISAVPVLKLLDADGNEVRELYGERDLSELRTAAASLILTSCAGQAADAPLLEAADSPPSCGVSAAVADATPAPSSLAVPAPVSCGDDEEP